MPDMNKVYYFEVDTDHGGTFVAAKSWKEARNMALKTEVIADDICDFGFTALHGRLAGNVTTPLSGELSGKQLDMLGIDYIKMEEL
jgi:hypothetical protein